MDPVAGMVLEKLIFVTGFARGGTSWVRDCIASHPDITQIPHEMVLFRTLNNYEASALDNRNLVLDLRSQISDDLRQTVAKLDGSSHYFVNKAPANAPYLGKAARLIPEAKFIFVVRDPRDVLISHQRGNQEWMRGSNSTVEGCMKKCRKYFSGYSDAAELPSVLLVKYEDLHQAFIETLSHVFHFIGVYSDADLIAGILNKNNFLNATGRRTEDRNAAQRKGVIGDWVNHLSAPDAAYFKGDDYWSGFMQRFGYGWDVPTYERILQAMKTARVYELTETDITEAKISKERPNLLLVHDIDLLQTRVAQGNLLETARIEGALGVAGLYNFLPLDDARYSGLHPKEIIRIIDKVRELSPRASVGLHFNAAERYFPADMEEVPDEHPDMIKAVAYLHEQVDTYKQYGIEFRIATAHGYGRRKKKPNNRDSAIFTETLRERGILLFDTTVRAVLIAAASHYVSYTDVGDALGVWNLPVRGAVDNAETYRRLPGGTIIHYLVHPANYAVNRKLTLRQQMRTKPLQAINTGF
ncbi:MAG: sulfotransferase family protein [Gammaproteobacteria bacterium]